ncbi:hypothetical protein BC830DRAFT_1134087 [Chytriomyces sp. MP71]|nr:hypothetical protein BC830DRAFT_1134087 [Chytriomyces sp. MP71]
MGVCVCVANSSHSMRRISPLVIWLARLDAVGRRIHAYSRNMPCQASPQQPCLNECN